ncbi:hypothetical protein AVEN_254925-1 [Araneus ventricosus]|uniref:Uncharacterized protein n=1 Tax=Araneus ventricosus TaxID=182803 RepID=A0A4Y2RLL6_ARAVE|nr:hypothetical protein AVEN_254925-1 [Araneus ventricosus]
MRSAGTDIPLSSPNLESSFPSIREVSSTLSPSPSDKELPPVFSATTGEVEPTPRPVEPTPCSVEPTPRPVEPTPRPVEPTPRPVEPKRSTAMIPEQRFESSTANSNTTESVPTAATLRRSSRVREALDRLMF